MSASYSESQASQTTQNIDKRVTTESGNIQALADNTLTVNAGGQLTVNSNDPATALEAIKTVGETTQSLVSSLASSTKQITEGSNAIAAQVADSQKAFVETASGQKTITVAVVIVAGLAVVFAIPSVIKSFRK